jgi:hypothetical protein
MGYSLAESRRKTLRAIGRQRLRPVRTLSLIAIAVVLGTTLAACYVAPGPYPNRGWCYYHPYRC